MTTAIYSKEQLNANVIGFGGKITGEFLIFDIIEAFLNAEYKATSENKQLIHKIDQIIPETTSSINDHLFDDLIEKWNTGFYND